MNDFNYQDDHLFCEEVPVETDLAGGRDPLIIFTATGLSGTISGSLTPPLRRFLILSALPSRPIQIRRFSGSSSGRGAAWTSFPEGSSTVP